MKKTYIIPTLTIIKVDAQAHMLFGSGGDETKNGGGDMGEYTGGQLSREGGLIWEEEEVQ